MKEMECQMQGGGVSFLCPHARLPPRLDMEGRKDRVTRTGDRVPENDYGFEG